MATILVRLVERRSRDSPVRSCECASRPSSPVSPTPFLAHRASTSTAATRRADFRSMCANCKASVSANASIDRSRPRVLYGLNPRTPSRDCRQRSLIDPRQSIALEYSPVFTWLRFLSRNIPYRKRCKYRVNVVNYSDLPRSGLPGPRLLRSWLPVSASEHAPGGIAAPACAGDVPLRAVRSVPLRPGVHSTKTGGARFSSRLNTVGGVASIVRPLRPVRE